MKTTEKMVLLGLAVIVGFIYIKAGTPKKTTTPTQIPASVLVNVKPGFAAPRSAPQLNPGGLVSQLYAGLQSTVGNILGILRARNANANFIVALNSNGQLIMGDPSGSIANSASVSYVNAQTNALTAKGSPYTLNSVIQSNLNMPVTLSAAPTVISKLFTSGKLDVNSQALYTKMLLYFVINNVWYFITDPYPPSIVVGKAYPTYDLINAW